MHKKNQEKTPKKIIKVFTHSQFFTFYSFVIFDTPRPRIMRLVSYCFLNLRKCYPNK